MSLAAPSSRTKVRQHPDRSRYDREMLLAILDEGLVCHLGFVQEGTPYVIPTLYARSGDTLYIHGAPASRMLKAAGSGIEVCLTVTLLDGLVLARSVFNHSMNYRSAVILGRATEVKDADQKMAASKALVDHVCRGRWQDARQPSPKELRATTILELGLAEASAKVRAGGPLDQEQDLELPVWAGEIPLRLTPLPPVPHEDSGELAVPDYARFYRRPGWTELPD
jgi:uncharacterized protein